MRPLRCLLRSRPGSVYMSLYVRTRHVSVAAHLPTKSTWPAPYCACAPRTETMAPPAQLSAPPSTHTMVPAVTDMEYACDAAAAQEQV